MSKTFVISGGTIIDGTGGPALDADVAIVDGRIAEIGSDLSGDEYFDAGGHVVAPGFIDIHTHYDAQVFWDPALTPSCFHGVTTVIAGNCGFSIAPTRPEHHELIARTLENVEDMDIGTLAAGIPWDFATFPEYLDSVEEKGIGLNFAAYIGHTALRLYVMGDDAYERAATADEIERMAAFLGEALDTGAAGFATSLSPTHLGVDGKPVPSRFAELVEIETLLGVLGERDRGVAAFTPGELLSVAQLYELQPKIGVPFTYTAMLTTPAGAHRKLVEINNAGWENGAEVWPQISPRPLTFAMTMAEPFTLNVNPVFAALMGKTLDERRRAYADPAWRKEASDVWAGKTGFSVPRWDTFIVADSTTHPDLTGRRVDDLASERGCAPLDVLLDLALDETDLMLRTVVVLANDDKDEVGWLLTQEGCTLGLSDAGAHVGQLCDAAQATDFLGNWVRERSVVSLERAVRMLSGQQADILGLTDRGYLRRGYWADVVVFDPATIDPGPIRRVRDFPAGAERLTADRPQGIRHVFVNGMPIQVDGERVELDAWPGQVLRPSARH
ncbi:MAG TPA: amidohydrolase family protein [Acidimicrobiales bacterium]|nr:amidohydrolase family protein [Acidimicrobiales bacterium]